VHTGAVVLGAGLLRPPLSLPPLGRFYLTPSPLLAIPPVAIRRESGQGVVSLSIPGSSSLIGTVLYSQALIVSPAGAHFTGWVADEIGR